MDALSQFVSARCHRIDGTKTKFSTFYGEFRDKYLALKERIKWTKKRVADGLAALGVERGIISGQVHLANFHLPLSKYQLDGRNLRREPIRYTNLYLAFCDWLGQPVSKPRFSAALDMLGHPRSLGRGNYAFVSGLELIETPSERPTDRPVAFLVVPIFAS
jgi:hypothetical protein